MSPQEMDSLAAKIAALSMPDKLRLAAQLLDQAKLDGGSASRARLAHTIATSVTAALGAALARAEIRMAP